MKLKNTLCAICGINIATTKDHIPPKSLYPRPRDNNINLNTVPACSECNNGASFDDEVFKVLIGIDTGGYQNNQERIIESLAKTIGENRRIASQVFKKKQHVFAKLHGVSLEPAVKVTFDFSQYERVINRIIRGLYWMETGRAMPINAIVRVFPGNQITPSAAEAFMELMKLLPIQKLNKDTFTYRWQVGAEREQVLGMQFFGRHTTFALVQFPSTR